LVQNVCMNAPERAVGYTTFPERKRAVSPEARYQTSKIQEACNERGLVLHRLVGDIVSHPGPDLQRPGLKHAMELLDSREVTCLAVANLNRLTASAVTLRTLLGWLEQRGARLIAIDLDLDTATKKGRLAARALAEMGRLEALRADGAGDGRSAPRRASEHEERQLKRRIAAMRASGMTLQAIADTLNREGVPTLRGGQKWRPSSVQGATGYRRPKRPASIR
jgi:DNA invertase Pin-like site-specific DNA recombinase